MDEGGLEQVEGQHGNLGVLAVGAGKVAVLAVEDDGVAGVPVLHDLQTTVDLAAQILAGEVVAGEDGAHRPAELLEGGVRRMLRAAAGESAQDGFGLGGAEPECGGVLDHLVVTVGRSGPTGSGGSVPVRSVGTPRRRRWAGRGG